MKDEIEVLLEMYKSQIARSEHYENQRATITNLMISLAVALIALATLDGNITKSDIWVGLLLFLLGLFGYSASRLHSHRSRRHGKRAESYRNALDKKLPRAGINAIREKVPEESTYLYRIWNGIPVAIMIIGLFILVIVLLG